MENSEERHRADREKELKGRGTDDETKKEVDVVRKERDIFILLACTVSEIFPTAYKNKFNNTNR